MDKEGVSFKSAKENFWGNGYIHYLSCDDTFTSIYMCQNSPYKHFKYFQFIALQSYLTRAKKKKNLKKKNLVKSDVISNGINQDCPKQIKVYG